MYALPPARLYFQKHLSRIYIFEVFLSENNMSTFLLLFKMFGKTIFNDLSAGYGFKCLKSMKGLGQNNKC